VTTFLAAFRFQFMVLRSSPHHLLVLATTPLLTVVFFAISGSASSEQTASSCVLAPALIALWTGSLTVAGEMIGDDRANGRLEAIVATPAKLSILVTARLCASSLLAVVCFAEAYVVAGLVFGRWVTVHHPLQFALAALVTVLAMAGTATSLSAVFVLVPSARTVQNTLTYPFYLLGGVLLPVSMLPEWVRPISRLVFLSWSGDLLRETFTATTVHQFFGRLAVIAALGAGGWGAGSLLIRQFVKRVRVAGTLAHT
jgi:ABC-2 type transport system permease protein